MKTRLPISAAAALFALVAAQPACAQQWMQTFAPYNWWTSVACSTNGTKLVAAGGGSVYTSTNSGLTWTVDGAFDGSVASSADGTKLVVATSGQGIRTSTNSGETWTLTPAR